LYERIFRDICLVKDQDVTSLRHRAAASRRAAILGAQSRSRLTKPLRHINYTLFSFTERDEHGME